MFGLLLFLSLTGSQAVNGEYIPGFGPNWGFATASPGFRMDPVIMSARTTFVVPDQPSPQRNQLALWPGIDTTTNAIRPLPGLIQSLAVSKINPVEYCQSGNSTGPAYYATNSPAPAPTDWFIVTSFYDGYNLQHMGPCAFARPGDQVHISYKYNYNQDSWNQQIRINNGPVVSNLITENSGTGYSFRLIPECKQQWDGFTPEITYLDTEVVLRTADTYFPRFLSLQDANSTGPNSMDYGKTWTVDRITLSPGPCQSND